VSAEPEACKRAAARAALAEVRDGMVVGLGSGSTAEHFVAELGARGLDIHGVPTSERIATHARAHGIPLASLDTVPRIDVTIDGADEIEPHTLGLTKGRGGSLLREKLVALASRRVVIIADASKLVAALGERAAIPVEVIRFGWRHTAASLQALGAAVALRTVAGQPFVTDEGHYILDCQFGPLAEPGQLATTLKELTGVVEHGLFLGVAHRAYVAGAHGVQVLDRPGPCAGCTH